MPDAKLGRYELEWLRDARPEDRWVFKLLQARGPMTPEDVMWFARIIHGDREGFIPWSSFRSSCSRLKQAGMVYVRDHRMQVLNDNSAELLAVEGDPEPDGVMPKPMVKHYESVIRARKRAEKAGWLELLE